jgi:hypothetical protein
MASISVQRERLGDERQSTREQRGLQLFEEHGSEITYEDGVWYVPSQHDATSVYEVTLGHRGEACECSDFEHRGQSCKHVFCALIARAKTSSCDCCRKRFPIREIVEVMENHESLTWFPGNLLCEECAAYTDVPA